MYNNNDGWDYIYAVAHGEDPDAKPPDTASQPTRQDSNLGSWGIVYMSLFKYGFSPYAICLYTALSIFADKFGRCFPSRAKLMEMTGIKSGNTFVKALNELSGKKFITVEHRRGRGGKVQSNIYVLTPQPLPPEETSDSPCTADVHGEGDRV